MSLYRMKGVMEIDDIAIVELYLCRDEAAIEHIARRYGARLRRLSYGIVEDMQTAEECENDTYLEAWERIPPHDPRSYLFAFLARIVRNLSIDQCRRRERLKRNAHIVALSAELEACIPAPDDLQCRMEAAELGEVISTFLKGLPKVQRNVFLRRYWYADTVEEICRRYLMGQSRVKSMLFRTRNALRAYLEKEGYEL